MDTPSLHPGPFDYDVLDHQSEHRSQDIWDNGTCEALRCRRLDGLLWEHLLNKPLHPRVAMILRNTGFYGIIAAGYTQLNHAMISSLLERWRPETHTFHLRTGEATITLQDVAVLYGLPIDGKPVTGEDESLQTGQWQVKILDLLGWNAPDDAFNGNSIQLRDLKHHLDISHAISDYTPDFNVRQRARCYILWIIGAMIAVDTTGSFIKLMYLPMLEDLDNVGEYAWGAATLAILYRYLCRASQTGAKVIAGFLPLLQVWIYERILPFRPTRELRPHLPSWINPEDGLPAPPRAFIWSDNLEGDVKGSHNLVLYRFQLDLLRDKQFCWQPYNETGIAYALPSEYLKGDDIFLAVVPLIAWDAVEWHKPDRVLRQFGRKQCVPCNVEWKFEHFSMDRRGKPNVDWAHKYRKEVRLWNQRREKIAHAESSDVVESEYLNWYHKKTRHIICNPDRKSTTEGYVPFAGAYEHLARSLHSVYRDSLSYMAHENTTIREIAERFAQLAVDAFTVTGQSSRTDVFNAYPIGNEYVAPERPSRRRARAESPSDEDEYQPNEPNSYDPLSNEAPASSFGGSHQPLRHEFGECEMGTYWSPQGMTYTPEYMPPLSTDMQYSLHTPYQSPQRVDSNYVSIFSWTVTQ